MERIIKVQQPLVSSGGDREYLIYDESRQWQTKLPPTPELAERMGESPKKYFKAALVGTILEIGDEVEAQDW